MTKIDADKCIGCESCISDCLGQAISIQDCKAVIDYEWCKDCGFCHNLCPVDAIYDDGVNPFREI